MDDADVTYLNGQRIGLTNGYNLPRRYAVPKGVLRAGENLIVVKIFDRVADGGIWGNAAELYLEVEGKRYLLAGDWEYRPSATTAMYGATIDATHPNNFASLLYNGMIHPWSDTPFGGSSGIKVRTTPHGHGTIGIFSKINRRLASQMGL